MSNYKAGDIVELGCNVFETEADWSIGSAVAKEGDSVMIRAVVGDPPTSRDPVKCYRCSHLNMGRAFIVYPEDVLKKVQP